MSKDKYQYSEDPFNVSRREFLAIGGLFAAFTAIPAIWIRRMAVKRNEYIRARTAGLYKDDSISKIRVSHANPGISAIYKDFLGQPLGELSENLLHTHYINRSKALA